MVLLAVTIPTTYARFISPSRVLPWAYCAYSPETAGQGGTVLGIDGIGTRFFGGAPVDNRIGQSYVSGVPPL